MAFVLIAVPLLRKMVTEQLASETSNLFDDSPLSLTGPGGTGKSRIVDAVRGLATAWFRPNAVMVTALTGIAAATLRGTTIHSSVGLGINQTRLPKHLQHPSQEQLEKWDPVLCIIADEMSMADLVLLGLWGQALCHLKENSKPFGGLIAVLMFDHCQLLSVRGVPLFKTSSPAKPFSPNQDYGANLYQAITKVVYLDESMRFNDDPEWGFWLAKARLGEWTPEFRAFIQSRADAYNCSSVHDFIQVVSSDNVTRSATNNMATKIAAATLVSSRRVYVAPAQLSSDITSLDLIKIRSLPASQTGGVQVFLPLYVG
ncbi:hypothetical protein F444_01832 [Phytophthora nicotianae P1976]|uniref:ATP-dependent DNA helicase n=1 Tax=Phytophthora nicotianae P1976 TaxID=1317066 RepID=A0A081AZD3_PHYNI|nr:hypothetical protein F444_01832 [Phytophthora nicotianae P1976]